MMKPRRSVFPFKKFFFLLFPYLFFSLLPYLPRTKPATPARPARTR